MSTMRVLRVLNIYLGKSLRQPNLINNTASVDRIVSLIWAIPHKPRRGIFRWIHKLSFFVLCPGKVNDGSGNVGKTLYPYETHSDSCRIQKLSQKSKVIFQKLICITLFKCKVFLCFITLYALLSVKLFQYSFSSFIQFICYFIEFQYISYIPCTDTMLYHFIMQIQVFRIINRRSIKNTYSSISGEISLLSEDSSLYNLLVLLRQSWIFSRNLSSVSRSFTNRQSQRVNFQTIYEIQFIILNARPLSLSFRMLFSVFL